MTLKITTGPWMAAAAPSSIVGWPIVGPGGRSVANVSWSPNHWQAPADEYAAFVATCEANARAIAAVPDLIGAAIAVKAIRPDNWDDGDDPEQAAAWRLLDAALAKATGGAK